MCLEEQKHMHKQNETTTTFPRIGLIIGFSLLMILSTVIIMLPAEVTFGQQGSSPNWAFSGAFLNYTGSSNWNGKLTLSNGSSMSISGNFTGSIKLTVNSVTNQANVTSTPNFAIKDKISYFNGTVQTSDMTETPANASSSLVSLDKLNFGNLLESELNSTNQLYSFSPTLNASLSSAPGVLYQLNSTTKVPALYFKSSVSEETTIPSDLSSTLSGSYSINGSSNIYVALAQNIPLKETLSLQGSTTLQNIQLGLNPLSASASGSFAATVTLASTNINLSAGNNVQQSLISVPNYSTTLDVMSNSTIDGAGTSGNQIVVNVTGPSGTTGVLDVVVSPSLLSSVGITSASQVGVTVDGQTYTNYTITNIGGSYVFTIYYHHSSHNIALSFGNANLGTNKGSVLSVTGGSPSALSLTTILEIASIAVVVVVVVLAVAFMRRRRTTSATAGLAPPAPSSAST